eukprot:GILK01004234.1.p1 GENE.GILK01004234.1~~GILK01004234.1.p1  ORF type:complete len:420 (-),score=87.76 GILK01004234.1:148-1407(-)
MSAGARLEKLARQFPSIDKNTSGMQDNDVYIVGAVRTPLGSYGGALSAFSATKLGGIAIKGALAKAGVSPDQVEEVIFGNVLSANVGQNPARQAAMEAGVNISAACTTINKVCASGMKATMFGAQAIMLGMRDIVVCGGMESMSNVPYYMPKARFGARMGHTELLDGMIRDGLWDVYNNIHMGSCAEMCAEEFGCSRADQDAFALSSYARTQQASAAGKFAAETVPVEVPAKKKTAPPAVVQEDEEWKKFDASRISSLNAVFKQGGTVTAANASPLSDGAAALVLVSGRKCRELNLRPLAKIRGFGDAEQAPERFTTAPAFAIPKALAHAGIDQSQVDFYELNEAFAVVGLVNSKLLNIDPSKVNVYGGAVALGHPLGCSGARIIVTLQSVLSQEGGRIGVAAICNGGGGASAIVIEKC